MQETITHIAKSLETLYPPEEIHSLTQLILEKVCNLSRNQQILCKDKQLSYTEKQSIQRIMQRLQNSEPIQYIFGETEFYGLTFEVTPAVLIPRPETEEMTHKIIQDVGANCIRPIQNSKIQKFKNSKFVPLWRGQGEVQCSMLNVQSSSQSAIHILDIGTGSGCIAVTLAKKLPNAQVYALDISEEAIQIARRNALRNDVTVHFIQANILSTCKQDSFLHSTNIPPTILCDPLCPLCLCAESMFDLIISNPPYVTISEKASMKPNVLDYEPPQALFVPDDDPIRFYRRIAEFALEKLTEHGILYLEINALFGEEICRMLRQKGYRNIEFARDLSGKERFIKAMI